MMNKAYPKRGDTLDFPLFNGVMDDAQIGKADAAIPAASSF
jgi:hypothetical protein